MAISGDYPRPVTVNGFSCKNCTDVDYAKKHIDPGHPKNGPYDINKPENVKPGDKPAVTFGGKLAGLTQTASPGAAPVPTQGRLLDISA